MTLSSLEGHRTPTSEEVQENKKTQKQFLNAFWKLNKITDVEDKKWNETVEELLRWFERQKIVEKVPIFDSASSSWLAFVFISNALGNIPETDCSIFNPKYPDHKYPEDHKYSKYPKDPLDCCVYGCVYSDFQAICCSE
ncbi:hypothetical protein FO519_002680 [Halicephalobus sp. NKZ332]|nr:hypothetical protein FO519_002680 [Halicephalobus sp. NKZ332]